MLDNSTAVASHVEPADPCSISDMARIYGVSLRTLRFYEDRGLLAPQRQGTARFYNANNRTRLELILKGKRLGFTLAEIQDLIASRFKHGHGQGNGSDKADLTSGLDGHQIEAQIAHLERQRSELDDALQELRQALGKLQQSKSA
ncbi:MerR family transcriptional regulator [Beijerinckia sp. L45]|uniref:MerR family transcriptional regulator n=1 Tax=Beijerinckia sp. L45 TaxID=1641855 RepID=UPI00131BBB4A|nr:MerR family transcriptional regulator [Beijerinckia sp. L45]